jgi:hypothetical protein
MNRRRHRLDALVRQVTRLGEEEAALLADPVVRRDIFEEITHMQSTETPLAPPKRAPGRLRLAVAASAVIVIAAAGFVAARLVTSGQQSPPVAGPTSTEQTGPTGDLFGDAGGFSCVEQYSPQTLAGRSFAFDGTVASIGERSSHPEVADPYVPITFTVQQWFRGGQGTTVTLAMFSPDAVSSVGNTTYAVGSRLLVSGERRGVEPGPDELVAWACGFTRWYDTATAAEWENALR